MRPGHGRPAGVAQERSALPEVGLLPHRNPVTGLVEEVVPRLSATPVMPGGPGARRHRRGPAHGVGDSARHHRRPQRGRRTAGTCQPGRLPPATAVGGALAPGVLGDRERRRSGRTVDRTATGPRHRGHRGAGDTGPPDTPALGRTRSHNDKADALSVAPSLNTLAAGRGHRRCASVDRAPRRSRPHPHPDHQPAARTSGQTPHARAAPQAEHRDHRDGIAPHPPHHNSAPHAAACEDVGIGKGRRSFAWSGLGR
jgi:hypothetical protein